jgi:pimeloyl-ACP methyl ester carboxylesterase
VATTEIAGGRTIHYDATGDGPPLLLIGGLGSYRHGWQPVVDALSPHFTVYRMDNRDAGDNNPEDVPYTIEDMAGDVAGFLDAVGVTRTPVLGHSMGGFIALHLALNRPDLVDRLLLVGTSSAAGAALGSPLVPIDPADWIDDPVERTLARAPLTHAPGFFDDKPDVLQAVAARTSGNRITCEGYNRQLAAISDTHDVRTLLSEISVPTLVLHGDADPLIPLRGGEVLNRDLPDCRLIVYPGVGHHPQAEMPEKFIEDVLGFLQGE